MAPLRPSAHLQLGGGSFAPALRSHILDRASVRGLAQVLAPGWDTRVRPSNLTARAPLRIAFTAGVSDWPVPSSRLPVCGARELLASRTSRLCGMHRAAVALNAAISAANSAFEAFRTAMAARIPPRTFPLSRLRPPGDDALCILFADGGWANTAPHAGMAGSTDLSQAPGGSRR